MNRRVCIKATDQPRKSENTKWTCAAIFNFNVHQPHLDCGKSIFRKLKANHQVRQALGLRVAKELSTQTLFLTDGQRQNTLQYKKSAIYSLWLLWALDSGIIDTTLKNAVQIRSNSVWMLSPSITLSYYHYLNIIIIFEYIGNSPHLLLPNS